MASVATSLAGTTANLAKAAPRILSPKWWTGVPALKPSAYAIDATPYAQELRHSKGVSIPRELRERMLETYGKMGVVLVQNSGLGELEEMGKVAKVVMGGGMEYEAGANPRSSIARNVFDVGAPEAAHLHYHHEMAYTGESVQCLGFCIKEATPDGSGATFLSHNEGVTEDILKLEVGRKLKDLGITYIRCLTDRDATPDESGVYNHWQKSFGVEDPEQAHFIANNKGLHVEWGPGRYMRTAYTVSAFEYFAGVDKNLLYSSVADDGVWFDAWPGVMELPLLPSFAEATPEHRPLKMTYGDGSPILPQELKDFCHAYDGHGFPLRWRDGDIAVFCNFRFAHGRPAFKAPQGSKRTIGVLLGPKFQRQGHRVDKW